MKPDLPEKYSVIEWDGKWMLMENTPTFRPVNLGNGSGTIQESDQRTVASFPKNSRVREVEKIALLDFMSRRPKLNKEERVLRMREFVEALSE